MSQIFLDASMLMLIGMSMVFVFLTLLTYCVKLLTHFTAAPLAPEPRAPEPLTSESRTLTGHSSPSNQAQMAAIVTAVRTYRASR